MADLSEGELHTLLVLQSGCAWYNASIATVRPQTAMVRFLMAKNMMDPVTVTLTPTDYRMSLG